MYYVKELEEEFAVSSQVAEAIITEDSYSEDTFGNILDEEEGMVTVCGCELFPSEVLKECDYQFFRQLFLDWVDNTIEDDRDEAERRIDRLMFDGDEVEINGYTVVYEEDEEDDEDDETVCLT